jgi:predicted RNase H-like HicB family nuclease
MITLDKYLQLPYRLVITPDDEGLGVEVPDLPGCFTHAEKWEDIQPMVREAMTLWLTVMLADHKPIPEPSLQIA